MGLAITQYRRSASVTRENPKYVAVVSLAFLAMAVVGVGLSLVPVVGPLLNNFVLAPLFGAGLLGLAYAAVEGQFSPRAFTASVKTNWKSLLGANLLMVAAMLGVLLLTIVLPAVLGTFVLGFGAMGAASGGMAGGMELLTGASAMFVLLVGLVAVPLTLGAALVLQFVPVSIVAGGESATSAFRTSWDVFRANPVSVLGFTALQAVTGLVVVAVPVAVGFGVQALVGTTAGLAAGGLLLVVAGAFVYAFFVAYQVLFYRTATEPGQPAAAA